MRASVTAPFSPNMEGLAAKDVHNAGKGVAIHDGHVQGDGLHAEHGGKAVEGHVEVGAVAIHFIDEHEGRQPASRTAFQMRRVRGRTRRRHR